MFDVFAEHRGGAGAIAAFQGEHQLVVQIGGAFVTSLPLVVAARGQPMRVAARRCWFPSGPITLPAAISQLRSGRRWRLRSCEWHQDCKFRRDIRKLGGKPTDGWRRRETLDSRHSRPIGTGVQPADPEPKATSQRPKYGGVAAFAQELCPAVLAPSKPFLHRGNLSADNLRLNGRRQPLALIQHHAEGLRRGQILWLDPRTSVLEITPDSNSATGFRCQISFAIAPPCNGASAYL